MDDVIMEKIVKDLEEADATGDKIAGGMLEVLALVTRWKAQGRRDHDGSFPDTEKMIILHKETAAKQVMTAIEKGMT